VRKILYCFIALTLAGCNAHAIIPAPQSPSHVATLQSAAGSYRTIFAFPNKTYVEEPVDLAWLKGSYYFMGVRGTIYELSPSHKLRALATWPVGIAGGLIAANGSVYAAYNVAGSSHNCFRGCGAIIEITSSGSIKTLYNFKGGADGAHPSPYLTYDKGKLYGMTRDGGSTSAACRRASGTTTGCGTIFALDARTGAESVLHRFEGSDGLWPGPNAVLVDNGAIVGTAYNGGGYCDCGTVFRLAPSGSIKVLHAFTGISDGSFPLGRLVLVGSAYYGVTLRGGEHPPCTTCGVTYSVDRSGHERIPYTISGGYTQPNGLTGLDGSVYGITQNGSRFGTGGNGTLFAVDATGGRIVHYFQSGNRSQPSSVMIVAQGALYGVTRGCNTQPHVGFLMCGTLYEFQPSGPNSNSPTDLSTGNR
jgi:uncharacterized repeat protein (TIGR03803 family)